MLTFRDVFLENSSVLAPVVRQIWYKNMEKYFNVCPYYLNTILKLAEKGDINTFALQKIIRFKLSLPFHYIMFTLCQRKTNTKTWHRLITLSNKLSREKILLFYDYVWSVCLYNIKYIIWFLEKHDDENTIRALLELSSMQEWLRFYLFNDDLSPTMIMIIRNLYKNWIKKTSAFSKILPVLENIHRNNDEDWMKVMLKISENSALTEEYIKIIKRRNDVNLCLRLAHLLVAWWHEKIKELAQKNNIKNYTALSYLYYINDFDNETKGLLLKKVLPHLKTDNPVFLREVYTLFWSNTTKILAYINRAWYKLNEETMYVLRYCAKEKISLQKIYSLLSNKHVLVRFLKEENRIEQELDEITRIAVEQWVKNEVMGRLKQKVPTSLILQILRKIEQNPWRKRLYVLLLRTKKVQLTRESVKKFLEVIDNGVWYDLFRDILFGK